MSGSTRIALDCASSEDKRLPNLGSTGFICEVTVKNGLRS